MTHANLKAEIERPFNINTKRGILNTKKKEMTDNYKKAFDYFQEAEKKLHQLKINIKRLRNYANKTGVVDSKQFNLALKVIDFYENGYEMVLKTGWTYDLDTKLRKLRSGILSKAYHIEEDHDGIYSNKIEGVTVDEHIGDFVGGLSKSSGFTKKLSPGYGKDGDYNDFLLILGKAATTTKDDDFIEFIRALKERVSFCLTGSVTEATHPWTWAWHLGSELRKIRNEKLRQSRINERRNALETELWKPIREAIEKITYVDDAGNLKTEDKNGFDTILVNYKDASVAYAKITGLPELKDLTIAEIDKPLVIEPSPLKAGKALNSIVTTDRALSLKLPIHGTPLRLDSLNTTALITKLEKADVFESNSKTDDVYISRSFEDLGLSNLKDYCFAIIKKGAIAGGPGLIKAIHDSLIASGLQAGTKTPGDNNECDILLFLNSDEAKALK